MGKLHKAYAITASIPTAVAAALPGSVVHALLGQRSCDGLERPLWIGHPSGVIDVGVETRVVEGQLQVAKCVLGRTARKIMEGKVYVSEKVYGGGV